MSFLHSRMVRDFGTTSRMWYQATRKTGVWTVEINCAAGPVTAKAAALIGALVVAADALILHATVADFPFEPRPEDVFIYGVTAATGRKYKVITAVTSATNHAHYRITAERQ